MKKIIACVAIVILALGFVACENKEEQSENKVSVADIETDDLTAVEDKQTEAEPETTDGIDLDLTTMSSTMVYSQVYNMVMTPETFVGQTVKMDGVCNMYQDPSTGKKYYACIVQDATQCCSQGIEFVLDENEYGEDDYPEVGESVVITGEFATYMEGENRYITLLNANLE